MDETGLGGRVKVARESLGMTQEDLAERLGVSRPTVSDIERGRRSLTALELLAASRCLRRPLAFFAGEEGDLLDTGPSEDSFGVRFRALDLAQEDQDEVFAFAQRCRDYKWVEDELGISPGPPPLTYLYRRPNGAAEANRQGEELAESERRRLGLGIDPLGDPFGVVESQGIRVILRKLKTDGVSGIFHFDDHLEICILVNASFPKSRWP